MTAITSTIKGKPITINVPALPPIGETLRLYMDDNTNVVHSEIAPEYFANGDGAYVLRRTSETTLAECAGTPRYTYNVA